MIDLHCHILPGVDDGAADIVESIQMARIAAKEGIKKIIAAPHVPFTNASDNFNGEYASRVIDEQVALLNDCLSAEKIPVEILRGAEVSAFLPPSAYGRFTLNRTGYLLVEFPSTHLPGNARDILFSMHVSGLKPIIAHPERNFSVIQNPEKLFELVEGGALVQITAESLTGGFGSEYRACAHYLLSRGVVSFVASDGHGAAMRQPLLSKAFAAVRKKMGIETALAYFQKNPQAVLDGRPLEKA